MYVAVEGDMRSLWNAKPRLHTTRRTAGFTRQSLNTLVEIYPLIFLFQTNAGCFLSLFGELTKLPGAVPIRSLRRNLPSHTFHSRAHRHGPYTPERSSAVASGISYCLQPAVQEIGASGGEAKQY
ncbi:unnamed protein product, partial [Ectocarpus sp. 4 AP-2014]